MADVLAERSAPTGLAAAALLRAIALSKTYRTPDHSGRLVLERIDFTLRDGEIVAILGKSGSGKSTFLRCLAGLIAPSEGRVEYRGAPVTDPVQGLAMVFQSFALFPWLTVLGNVELGLEAQPLGGDVIEPAPQKAIEGKDIQAQDPDAEGDPRGVARCGVLRDVGADAGGVQGGIAPLHDLGDDAGVP